MRICCDAEKMIQLEEHATCCGETICTASRWNVWFLSFVKLYFFLGGTTDNSWITPKSTKNDSFGHHLTGFTALLGLFYCLLFIVHFALVCYLTNRGRCLRLFTLRLDVFTSELTFLDSKVVIIFTLLRKFFSRALPNWPWLQRLPAPS